MAIIYTEGKQDNTDADVDPGKDRFESLHSVHSLTLDGKHLISLTGIVRVDLKGKSSSAWHYEDITIRPKVIYIPKGKALDIEHWAPFVTLNTVFNQNEANSAGWGVDSFRCDFSRRKDRLITYKYPFTSVVARVAVRDSDGWVLRLGYHITLYGKLIDWVCTVDDPDYDGDEPF